MKLFSSSKPNYYIELDNGAINTQLLATAIQDSPDRGVEGELQAVMDQDSLNDFLLTFGIDHPYAQWLKQFLPFINHYKEAGEDVKLPDAGYWNNHRFKLIEVKEEEVAETQLLRIDDLNPQVDFVSFDVESTGVVVEVDRILQIAAVKYRNNEVVDTFDVYVKPDNYDKKEGEFYISDTIVDLTGITDKDIKDAPSLKEVAPAFLDFIKGEVLVGHNLIFDIDILTHEFERNGLEMPAVTYYDTLIEARQLIPFQPRGGYRLEVLKERIGMGDLDSHDALNDCYMAGELFQYLHNQKQNQ